VGASGYGGYGVGDAEPNIGQVYLFLGTATGLTRTWAWLVEGTQNGEFLGIGVSISADTNGDGFKDVLATAPGWDDWTLDNGLALAFLGAAF